MNIALIGLGTMGRGMASRLLKAGFHLSVFNRTGDRAKPLVGLGAHVASSPRLVSLTAEIVISMVSDDDASRSVWLGPEGVLNGIRPGTVMIESSTLSPKWVEQLAAHAAERGCQFLDAPVTGSKTQAESGQLVFVVGGDETVLARVRPVLEAMSREIAHFGPVGSGTKIKLLNNLLVGIQVAAFAEMLALAERIGVEPNSAGRFVSNGAPGSPIVKLALQRIAADDFAPNFSVRLMAKDLAYAVQAAESASASTSMAQAAKRIFECGIEEGLANRDLCSIIQALRQLGKPSRT